MALTEPADTIVFEGLRFSMFGLRETERCGGILEMFSVPFVWSNVERNGEIRLVLNPQF